jgi:gliding motility-associated-like protein
MQLSDSVTYNITATDKGCTKTTQVKVIILKTPTKPNLGNDTVVCGAFTKTLSAGQNANWTRDGQSAGTNVANITVSQVGTYIATVSNQCGTASDTIIITQNNTPTKPNLGADLNICGTINQALNAGQLANWTRDGQSAGSNVANITATQVGTYIATVSNQCGTVSDTIAITQNNTPTKPNLGADLNICGTINQALNAGQLANWTRDGQSAGTNVANITATQAGTYIVTISNQCGTASDTIIITQNNTPTKPNLGADLNICGTINQALNAGQLANWTRDGQSAGTNVANITATQAGTYIVTISNQCGTASDTIIITQNNTPTKPNLGADLNICGTINQALNVGQLANWTRDGQNAGTNVENITVTQVGTYIATVSNQCGTVSDTIVISQENVSVQITGNTEVCNGSSVTLSVAGQYDSIRWSNGATTSSINVTVPNAYSVNVYRNGCSATAQTTVTECQQQICNPTILGDTIFCNGTSITLNAGAGFDSYAWNNGQSGQTITISQGGQFIVNVSGQNCIGTDTINVRLINPPVAFNIGKDTAYCGTFTRTISTSNGEPATWSTGATGTSITVNEAGTYTATISNQCGSEQAEITITQKALPTVDLRADTSICTGASTTLDATFENATYLWNTGAETATIEVSTEGTYSVTVTLDGCTATDSKLVSVLNPPTVFNIGKDTAYCGAFTRTISTSNGEPATWSTGATATSITVNEAGTYTATISNQCGSEQAEITITQKALPTVDLRADTSICTGASTTLDATFENATYLWNTGAETATIEVSTEGTYSVTVTLDGCTATDSKLVSVLNPPTAFNIGNDTTYCGNFSRILSTNNANTTWSTGATGANITVNEAGTYTATISNQCGTEQASVNIFKNELPYVSLGKDTALCYDAIELSIGQNDFQSVLWSTQEIGNSITVEDEGIYFVSVTDNNNCSNTDTINVGINCKNEVWVPNAFTPNGDNMNDVFYVRGNPKNVKIEKMIVFDRWGNKIFETGNILPDNKVFGWDGTYKGKKQQVEAYGYYVKVKYIDGSTQELKGNVTLLE